MAKVKNCEWCGAEFEDKHRDGKRFCGRSCARYYTNATFGNPQRGKSGDQNPNWRGGTIRKCAHCFAEFHARHYGDQQFCGRSCASKHRAKPKDAPVPTRRSFKIRKAKPVRQNRITRNPIRKSEKVVKQPRQPSICPTCNRSFITKNKKAIYCGLHCYHNSPNFAEIQGKRNRGKPVPEHAKQAVSLSNTRRNAEQEYTSGINGHHDSPKAGNIFYRSSYERIAYELLDNDATVAHYMPEPFAIEYTNQDGNTRRYRPDILVSKEGQTVLVEVKPQWKLSDLTTQLKIEAGKQYAAQKGWVFEVWTEKELGI